MITYLVCLLIGLIGIGVVFVGRDSEAKMIVGSALYFIAIFWAAIHSIHGALI